MNPISATPMHFRSVRLLILSAAALSLAGCRITTAPDAEVEFSFEGILAGSVKALASPEGLVLSNQTARQVFYFAVERETAALIDWYPCVDGTRCSPLAPGERRTIPWDRVNGYANDRHEYLLYFWYVDNSSGTPRAAGTQSAIVTR